MKMHRKARLALLLLLLVVSSGQLFARDFSRMSDEELSKLQEQLQELSADERKALFAEMERRLEARPVQPVSEEPSPPLHAVQPAPGKGPGPGNDPRIRQIRRYGEPPRTYGQPPPAYGQGPSGGIGRGIPRR